jgi:hypothetical protein
VIRVLLTVTLAVAVVAVSAPGIERAGVQRSDEAVRSVVDHLVTQARALDADSDAVPGDLASARRVVELDLPERGAARAGLAELRLAPPRVEGADGTRVTWRVEGGTRHVARVEGLALRPPGRGRGAVVFETGGDQRVVLELVRTEGRRVVLVNRRGFK